MAKKGKAQIWIEYAVARVVYGSLSMLPRRVAVSVGIGIAKLGFHVLPWLRKAAFRNLEIAFPGITAAEQRRLAKGTFINLGRVLGEASQFSRATKESIAHLVDFELDAASAELYRRVKEEKRGVLITTGHLGNWELLVLGFAALYQPISYLARPLDNPLIEEMTFKIRTRFGNTPLNKTNSLMPAIRILREGGILGILSDVNSHQKAGVFVPFFGVQACTPNGAAIMAIRAQALIFPTFCVWEKDIGKYKFVHGAVIEPTNTGDRKRDIIETTAAYTAEIEKIIRAYPDQWMWVHKRWKTRPAGEADLY